MPWQKGCVYWTSHGEILMNHHKFPQNPWIIMDPWCLIHGGTSKSSILRTDFPMEINHKKWWFDQPSDGTAKKGSQGASSPGCQDTDPNSNLAIWSLAMVDRGCQLVLWKRFWWGQWCQMMSNDVNGKVKQNLDGKVSEGSDLGDSTDLSIENSCHRDCSAFLFFLSWCSSWRIYVKHFPWNQFPQAPQKADQVRKAVLQITMTMIPVALVLS